MEVHHHTHSQRKKWTHYFWEFLMLFLAVFCGFLAEYKLEHTIEHNREKQFIATLIEDLKSDTAQLTQVIAYKNRREKMADSLIMNLSSPDYGKHGSDIYYYARNLTRPQYFFPNDRTIQQLKNSGSLRLIRKMAVSDRIMYYDQQVRYLLTLNEDERSIRDNFRDLIGAIFDGKVFYSQIDSTDFANYKRPDGNPPLFITDPASINKVVSGAQYLKSVTRGIRDRQERIRNTAAQLLLFLQKEYRLQ
ncbi:MAG TPA: hypothetical protein VFH08_09095 [Chitinophagaceae bacterium]|nr:hypothetical protein [Chitinophagaceae bacterium]